jgi:hypothetical protein
MKRLFLFLGIAAMLLTGVSSCVAGRSMKRDCQGVKHVRLKNGIYI